MEFKPFDLDDQIRLTDALTEVSNLHKYFDHNGIRPPMAFTSKAAVFITRLGALVSDNMGEDNPRFPADVRDYPSQMLNDALQVLDLLRRAMYHIPHAEQHIFDTKIAGVHRLIKHYIRVMSWMLHHQTKGNTE